MSNLLAPTEKLKSAAWRVSTNIDQSFIIDNVTLEAVLDNGVPVGKDGSSRQL